MPQNVPDRWQITDVGNIDALRSSLPANSNPDRMDGA
jgi:hypothetical protein